MKRINLQSDANNTGNYPLFFGEPLGLFDSFNEPYPELATLSDLQQSFFWPAREIDLSQDAVDIANADPNTIDLLIENLSFQMAADSVASGTISGLFLPILSNHQAVELIEYHSMSESIHAKAYLRIIAEAFNDPNKLLNRIKGNEKVLRRLDVVLRVFGEHKKMLRAYEDGVANLSDCRKQVIKTCAALLALEGIMFITSFSNTFALTEATQKFNGISKLVGLIRDDEFVAHKNNMITFLKIMRDKEKYPEWNEVLPEVKLILDTVVNQELAWADHLFTMCKPLIGFNAATLKEYVLYTARAVYDSVGIQWDYPIVNKDPFVGWLGKYVKADMIQTAAQESEISNYLTGLATDDTDGEDFDY